MRRQLFRVLFFLPAAVSQLALAQQIIEPVPVDPADITTAPFSYNGTITSAGAYGSGSMIANGVMATAAHVVYDETIPAWIPIGQVRYYPGINKTGFPTGDNYTPFAYYKWDEYSTRVAEDDSGPEFSTPNTFNLDFAVASFSVSTTSAGITQHAEVNIDKEGEVTIHRHPRDKMVVGYPRDVDNIDATERGLMHMTEPGNYFAAEALENIDMPGFDFGAGNPPQPSTIHWASVYYLEDVTTYSGQSGGPVYVKDDADNWMMSGIVVGGVGSTFSLIRSIDENAWNGIVDGSGGIKEVIIFRNGTDMMRVETLQASITSENSIEVTWTDESSGETGYTVFRQENGEYEHLADLPADSQSYVDSTVEGGKTYHYRVQPYQQNQNHTNKSPKSDPVSATVPGSYAAASNYLALDLLQVTSSGDSSWFIDTSDNLRAGVVRSMGSSSLFLDIIGPGSVNFDWSTSCELNIHYNNNNQNDPDSQYFGLIYDALWLYMDGTSVEDNNEPVFLSGPAPDSPTDTVSESGIQLIVPEGPHRIEWRYEKDPYSDEYQDTGFLDSLSWTPDASAPYPVYGGYKVEGSSWHVSQWFGQYDAALWPWVAHEELGWLYMLGGNSSGKGAYFNFPDPPQDRIGTVYTTPAMWPYLYRPETDSWMYYLLGTGVFGEGCYVYDYAGSAWILTGN